MAGDLAAVLEALDAGYLASPFEKDHHYGLRMREALAHLTSAPSPPLQIAVSGQHYRRWQVPRSSFPETRAGYLAWRKRCAEHQGAEVEQVCQRHGFPQEQIDRVKALIAKQHIKTDEDAQHLEDAACLVFLRYELDDFIQKLDTTPSRTDSSGDSRAKLANIVIKTWNKMSERGRGLALTLPFTPKAAKLLEEALHVAG